jgi:CheY-like chemotaxis protein
MSHVLVVEDDDIFRAMMEEMLRRDGHQVRTASNGAKALIEIERQAPELIITDILMPEKDGIELITELSQRDSSVPIIAVSGGRRAISQDFNLESARLMGVKVTLPKPFTREQLREAISTALA